MVAAPRSSLSPRTDPLQALGQQSPRLLLASPEQGLLGMDKVHHALLSLGLLVHIPAHLFSSFLLFEKKGEEKECPLKYVLFEAFSVFAKPCVRGPGPTWARAHQRAVLDSPGGAR